jgi:hypothetical protein
MLAGGGAADNLLTRGEAWRNTCAQVSFESSTVRALWPSRSSFAVCGRTSEFRLMSPPRSLTERDWARAFLLHLSLSQRGPFHLNVRCVVRGMRKRGPLAQATAVPPRGRVYRGGGCPEPAGTQPARLDRAEDPTRQHIRRRVKVIHDVDDVSEWRSHGLEHLSCEH